MLYAYYNIAHKYLACHLNNMGRKNAYLTLKGFLHRKKNTPNSSQTFSTLKIMAIAQKMLKNCKITLDINAINNRNSKL